MATPQRFADADACAEALLTRLGKRIVLGLPVGLGKPVPFVNALVRRACEDPSLSLTILTALSFRVPRARNDLERRLLEPIVDRVFGGTPALAYTALLERDELPPNIEVAEFFLEPGGWLDNAHLQQHYLSVNYTHVIREALRRGLNCLAQIVATPPPGEDEDGQLSLSCNPDLTVDLLPHVAAARAEGRPFALIGQLHRGLPYLYGDARIPEGSFDFLIDGEAPFRLFAPPNPALDDTDHCIGLGVSALVKDGGTIQVGIGELGDAVVHGLLLRHRDPALYRRALTATGIDATAGGLIGAEGGTTPFARGLYACSEMFADGFLDLYEAGILKRSVYPSARIQQLLDDGRIGETVDAGCLEALQDAGVRRLSYVDFQELRDVGVLRDDLRFDGGSLVTPDGLRIPVDLCDPASREAVARHCLGRGLKDGVVMDAGFFFGPAGFYARLHALPAATRRRFAMRGISFVNDLKGPEPELKAAQRRHARFINTTMMVTALGAAVSDGLEDGRVVSGVGGQYNFVAMAHGLPEARSILCLRSTRTRHGRTTSNIVWNYGHTTIPRHLRDIVVTEYGVADLRGRSDAEVIAALVGITDARFQDGLVAEARRVRKLPAGFRVPDRARLNTPDRVRQQVDALRTRDAFGEYPFGTELTPDEIVLRHALQWLGSRTATRRGRLGLAAHALAGGRLRAEHLERLERMGLAHPATLREWLLRRLVTRALEAVS